MTHADDEWGFKQLEEFVQPNGALGRALALQAPDFVDEFKLSDINNPIFLDVDMEARERILRNLLKPTISSVVITGESGVGKSGIVDSIAYDITKTRNIPERLKGYRVFYLDIGRLSEGSEHPGRLEKKIEEMVDFSKRAKVIWVIDEIHGLRGQGTHQHNSNDIFQWLKPHMTRGYVKIIGMSTHDEFNDAFSGDTALRERFHEVKIEEPKGGTLIKRLRNWVKAHYGVVIADRLLEMAVQYSEEYNAVGRQPRKATLLLEEAFALLEFRGEKHEDLNPYWLTEAVKDIWHIPEAYFDPDEKRALMEKLPSILRSRIQGQEAALDVLLQQAQYAFYGLQKFDRPRLGVLLVGPSGTGKTESIYAFSEAMGVPLERIMMSDFSTAGMGAIEDLKHRIFQAVNRNAFSVLFFDEMEKAPEPIQNALLDLLDKGQFSVRVNLKTDGVTKRTLQVDIRRATVVMASNAGQSYIREASGPSRPTMGFTHDSSTQQIERSRLEEEMVRDGLSLPVLDRMKLAIYRPLDQTTYGEVVRTKWEQAVAQFAKDSGVRIRYEASELDRLIEFLTERYYEPSLSTRKVDDILDAHLREQIVDFVGRGLRDLQFSYEAAARRLVFSPANASGSACQRVFPNLGRALAR